MNIKRFSILFIIFCFIKLSVFAQDKSNSFSATSISGLSLWLSADSVENISGKINSWYDKSGNNILLSQADSSKQPIVYPQILEMNNMPSIHFDGNNDYLIGAFNSTLSTDSITIYFVQKTISAPNYSASLVFVNNNQLINDYTHVENIFAFLNNNNSSVAFRNSNFSLFNNDLIYIPAIYQITADGTTLKTYLNTTYTNQINSTGTFAFDKTIIGSRWEGIPTNPMCFDIYEIILYNRLLTPTEQSSINQYLRQKYAPAVNLGPDINTAYGYCNKLLDASARFTNYLWSTGDTVQTISINNSGTYWVQVKDIFGYSSRDTINITFPSIATPTGSSILCQGSTKVWDTGKPKNTYSFLWQDSVTTDSLFNITQAGQYYVKITDTLGCFKMSDTVTISIDSFSTIADLGPPLSLCSGNSIYLTNGATQATNYTWSDSSNNDSFQVIQPIGTYLYWVTVSDSNSCSKTDSIDVTVVGSAPTPDFTFNTTCFGNITQFTDLSAPTGTSTITNWLWDFGDPSSGILDTSTFQNPQHFYATAGTFTVRLIVRTNAGCEAPVNKLITIHPKPIVSFTETNLCSNSNVLFTGTATTFGDPITNWNWNFGDASSGIKDTSTLQNPSHIFVTGGTSYTVQLTVQNMYGCADTVISGIGIKKSPVADFNYSIACKDQAIQFTDSSTFYSSVIAGTLWNFGDGITIISPANPMHTYASNVGYQVIHVVTDNYNCKDSVIKTVQVNPVPDAYFSIGNSCVSSPTDFTDLSVISSGSITNWQWNFNNVATSGLQNSQYTFNAPGNVTVGLLITSNKGCKDSLTQTFAVHPLPVADYTFTPQYGNPPLAVTFTNTSTGASSYLWNFGDGSAVTTIVNPLHTYIDTGSFAISLSARDNFGCEQTKIKIIPILRRLVDVAIMAIYDTLQNNYLNTSAQIVNLGTTDITSMDIYITVNNGPAIKENWTGLLQSSTIISYKSGSSVYLKDATHYVCLTIENPNHVADENPANNKLCEALDVSVFQILDMYPNPSNEVITLPLIIPELKNLIITIYDANGKKVKSAYSGNIDKGLQLITINIMELNSGFYGCKIEYGNESFIKKFIKK